jgi:hypothetical protein
MVQGGGRIQEDSGGRIGICFSWQVSASFDLRCYTCNMSSKLSTANPYLRDPVARRRSVFASVASSSAIEGIHAPFKQAAVTPPSGSAASTQASTALQGGVTRPKP